MHSVASLTTLGDIEGASPYNSIYGAQIDTVQLEPSHFETTTSYIVEAPWLAQKQEATYMNRTKPLNELPVETYKYLKLSSIPQQPVIYEGFDVSNEYIKIFVIIIMIIIVLYVLFYQIK